MGKNGSLINKFNLFIIIIIIIIIIIFFFFVLFFCFVFFCFCTVEKLWSLKQYLCSILILSYKQAGQFSEFKVLSDKFLQNVSSYGSE